MQIKLIWASGQLKGSTSHFWYVTEWVDVNTCQPFIIHLLLFLWARFLYSSPLACFLIAALCFLFPSCLALVSALQRGIAFEWRPQPWVLLTVSEPCNYVILCLGFVPLPVRPQSALAQPHTRRGWLDILVFQQPMCTIIWSVTCAALPIKIDYSLKKKIEQFFHLAQLDRRPLTCQNGHLTRTV